MNFKDILNDVLEEKHKRLNDLVKAKIISEKHFYRYKDFNPYLLTLISMANYLEVSIDYLLERTTENNFRKYNTKQDFYKNLCDYLNKINMTKTHLCENVDISTVNFVYWKRGSLPNLNTLLSIVDYLGCSIDDLVDFE